MKVFVSNDISEKGVALLREHFDVDIMPNMEPDELIKVINNYDALVTRSLTRVTKEVIEWAPRSVPHGSRACEATRPTNQARALRAHPRYAH